jgi:peptidoglycan-N-acetylglucosamine deacetylase
VDAPRIHAERVEDALGESARRPDPLTCDGCADQSWSTIGNPRPARIGCVIRQWINGDSLEDGQFCLTFDDGPGESISAGPGPRTVELAQYLADQAVPATFFLCGKHIQKLPRVPARLRQLGHAVGNHTNTHPRLPDLAASGGDVVGEVIRTADLLGAADGEKVWLRPPYGLWDEDVATLLDAESALSTHAGPVMWNVGGDDWRFWRDGKSPQQCADEYLAHAERRQRGIILMHDCTADNDQIKAANRTYETVRLLLPTMRQRGYSIVSLDSVPA